LNAEWNKPKDREVNLHRHPAFFGSVEDVIADCCGHCPPPVTIEEEEVAAKERKMYVAGTVTFMKDDCGRQAIGSFHPLSPDEYTDMAYVGNTELLCQAIIDKDLHYVEQWLRQEGNDPNTRDHTGRCPLHLAVSYSSVDVVQCLIDHGARLVARLVDGKTALHLACLRGDPAMVSVLLRKSESNEEDEMKKSDEKRRLRMAAKTTQDPTTSTQDDTFEMIDKPGSEMDIDAMTDGSMVHVKDHEVDAEGKLDGKDDDSPDVYDVNVLTWDTPTSPLHLAILSGHEAVVECLVQDFGANVLLPVILPAQYAGGPSSGVLLNLTLAFTLPLSEAKDMTRLLFKLGASSAQADPKRKTALQYCVSSQPNLLETYLTFDPVGVARAIKHVTVQGYSFRPETSGPLLEAISNQDLETAIRLLSAGARADLPFEAYLKGVEKSATRSQFENNVEQPVVRAIEAEMPLLGGKLIEEHGVDSNTLTTQGWSCVHSASGGIFGHRKNGQSLLDVVNDKIKGLRDWKHETTKDDPPIPLEEDSFYLSSFPEGTYQHWYAVKQIEKAKSQYEREWKDHAQRLSKTAHDEVGLEEKQAAVYDKLDQFRKLESVLQTNSAKTFKQLHPEIEETKEIDYRMNHYYPTYRAKPEPFKLTFGFSVAMPNEEVRMRYIHLFEAVWKGDVKTIKELALLSWVDTKGEKREPLQIAIQDDQKHSPLSIAVFSGNLDLAKMVMSIAAAQYTPPEPPKAQQYRVATDCDSDAEGDDSGDEDGASADLPITSEAIDDNMTIEDIGEVSLSVKSNIRPEQMLGWQIPQPKHAVNNLLELALAKRDMQLLTFLLDLYEEYMGQLGSTDTKNLDHLGRNLLQQHLHLSRALSFADPYMLAELIKRTAIGLSIDHLALEHGANDTTSASKYYQGLSVHGRKRKDWADAGRNTSGNEESGPQVPPLLQAAFSGTLEQVEWMLSDAPLRCYKHFAQAHQDDKNLQKFQSTTIGFEGALKGFLNNRSQLAIHCCIARTNQATDTLEKLNYLIEALPDAVEARSADQRTPLLRAFHVHDLEAARVLINAGADQTARDQEGMNLLHQLVCCYGRARIDIDCVRAMVDLIDKRLLASMCLQRTSANPGSLTPLALWLARLHGSEEYQLSITRLLLELGGKAQLETLNGEGLTVLHTAARMSSDYHKHAGALELAKILLEHHSDLATWENATGKTSLELVEDSALALKCSADGGNNTRRRSRYQHDQQSISVKDLPPREFIKRKRNVDDTSDSDSDDSQDINPKRSTEKMRKLLASTQAKLDAEGRGRRRLVTLNEASEVARRLAAIQRKKIETEDENAARRENGEPARVDLVERMFNNGY
jgi:ankyrin repeat protein